MIDKEEEKKREISKQKSRGTISEVVNKELKGKVKGTSGSLRSVHGRFKRIKALSEKER